MTTVLSDHALRPSVSHYFTVLCFIQNLDSDDLSWHTNTYAEASPLCTAYGGVLAAPGHVHQAWENGMDVCSYALMLS